MTSMMTNTLMRRAPPSPHTDGPLPFTIDPEVADSLVHLLVENFETLFKRRKRANPRRIGFQ